jgi:hypothetical protein
MEKLKYLKNLIILILIVGFPVIPGLNLPFLVFIIPFYLKQILYFFSKERSKLYLFLIVSILYLIYSALIYEGVQSILFAYKLYIKILLSLLAAVIVVEIIKTDLKLVYYWLLIQSCLIIFSILSNDIYDFLAIFLSGSSRETFTEIFGLRSIGFGIYHVEGAIVFVFLSYLFLISELRAGNIKIPFYISFIALTMSRSSIFLISLVLFLKRPLYLLIYIAILLFLASYVTEEHGPIYWAFELFINYKESGLISSTSSDANKEMLIFPSKYDLFFGHGKFFDNDGLFYMNTDLGISRMLFFGGLPYLLLFTILNLIFINNFFNEIGKIKINFILFSIFIILNFKGIFIVIFYYAVIYILSKRSA